jgi:hypothetical protein
MGALRNLEGHSVMASRWRRRRMCVLVTDAPAPAALRAVSATGAFLETNAKPAVGSRVELRHPEAGAISGEVRAVCEDGVKIGFDYGEKSVAFALAAIAADMSRPTA